MKNNIRGIGAIIIGSICFSVNDVSVKLFSSEYALHQLMFFRAVFAIIILLLVVLPFYGGLTYLSTRNPLFHFFRGMAVVGANTFFFLSQILIIQTTSKLIIKINIVNIFFFFNPKAVFCNFFRKKSHRFK